MKGKKKVNIYTDWNESIKDLSNEDAGKLFKHLLAYVNDENPPEPKGILKYVWIPIKQTLKRDLDKWLKTCEKNKENIEKRWNKKDTDEYDRIGVNTKNTDKDRDIDKDKDIDREIIDKTLFNGSERFNVAMKRIGVKKIEHGKYLLSDLFPYKPMSEYKDTEDFWRHFENWGRKFEFKDAHREAAQKMYGVKPNRYLSYEEAEEYEKTGILPDE